MAFKNSTKAFVFYVLALGLAILVRLAVPILGEASLPLNMLTPAIVTALMLSVFAPEGGFRQAVVKLGLTRTGLRGWLPAIGGPALIHAVGLIILTLAGLTTLAAPQISGSFIMLGPDLLIGFFIGILFALGEEVGWRGYMLPHMKGFGKMSAMLIVGFLHGVWHLPILLTTNYYHSSGNPWLVTILFLVTLTLAGAFYGFLRIWSGSVWPVAIAHGAANTAWNFSSQVSQTKSPAVLEYIGGESGLIMIGGLLIINFGIWKYLSRGGLENVTPL